MLWIRVVIGAVMLAVGVVWIAQGVDLLGGSFMSGQFVWAIIGTLVGLAGLGLVVTGVRGRPS